MYRRLGHSRTRELQNLNEMGKHNSVYGKILYAIVFLFAVPMLQWWWAKSTKDFITYPPLFFPKWGIILSAFGILFMLYSMFILMKYGKGLPMNAYPPEFFVNIGPYSIVAHPIYFGYALTMVGVSIYFGSASALWFVTPISILAIIALVIGYENQDLKKRFPNAQNKAFLKIPEASITKITIKEKVASFLLSFFLCICANYVIYLLVGTSRSSFPIKWALPGFDKIHIVPYLVLSFIFIFPLITVEKRYLRQWIISVLISLSLSVYISLLLPSIGAQYFYISTDKTSLLPILLSSPLFLTFISAKWYLQSTNRYKFPVIILSVMVLFFKLISSQFVLSDFFFSILVFLIADNYSRIWQWLRNLSEMIANSWQEWIFRNVRIINRGFYVGFGAFFGILLAGVLVGKAYAWAILMFSFIGIICSALWAQLVEGSEKLKRPFGYYGALVGIIFASFVIKAMGFNVWVLIGVLSVFMPWVQAAGRIGCLVNGCCHGRKTTNNQIGIRYFHPRSRVCGLSHMKGELLHPTQLYSILWLTILGFIMLSLWHHQFSYSFIFGIYLILTSLGRFVEESYRGEVQTPIIKGLRLYQWVAICTFLIGIFMTTLRISIVHVQPDFGWQIGISALLGGLFSLFAMGVDFPNSNYRFSRLV